MIFSFSPKYPEKLYFKFSGPIFPHTAELGLGSFMWDTQSERCKKFYFRIVGWKHTFIFPPSHTQFI